MKISIIGAGNVGSLTAMRLAEYELGDIFLVDILKGLAQGRALDLEDSRPLLENNHTVKGTDDIKEIENSGIVIITAGLTRKPGMSREELLAKNANILKSICLKIKELSPHSIIIVVTNPLDILTYLTLKITGFKQERVLGMGPSLDSARFTNLISQEFNVSPCDVETCVIGAHGEGMLPLPRFSKIKGVRLDEFCDHKKIEALVARTKNRGLEIVSLLPSGSASFAPSAAIAAIVKTIVKDEKRTIGVSAYLDGEYGAKGVSIGVPCLLGREGIEKIVELDLNKVELEAFLLAANNLKKFYNGL